MAEHRSRAVFRLEFGGRRGWGHLVRCAAFAAELQRRNWTCLLWTTGSLTAVPEELGRTFTETILVTHDWMEAPPPEVLRCALLVIDFCELTDGELVSLSNRLHRMSDDIRLLVIDDDGRRKLSAADMIVNSRLGLTVSPYAPQVPALLGEKYVLLRSGLNHPADIGREFSPGRLPVLIIFGGTDPAQMTAMALDALADVDTERFVPVVVRSRSDGGDRAVAEALLRFRESLQVERLNAALLAGWARRCRFAITAAGGTIYELAFLRLPFVSVVVADNQREQAKMVARQWRLPVVDVIEGHRKVIADAVRSLAGSFKSARFSSVDGRGPARIADAMEERGLFRG